MASPMPRSTGASVLEFFRGQLRLLTGRKPCFDHAMQCAKSVRLFERLCLRDHIFCVSAMGGARSATGDAAGMKLLLIEIAQLRTEVEQLRGKEEETQSVKEFLYRVIESRDQWQREAQRLRALMAKVPPWLLFCGRCLDAFKASREGSEGLDLHQSPSQSP
jgi:hypothetical protein